MVLVGLTGSPDSSGLATELATELLGFHPGPLHHLCGVCGSVEHGRPSFDAGVEVSVAHTTGLSIVAVSTDGPVGIDVEVDADAAWVRAEAIGKAYGVGLTGSVGEALTVDLDLDGYVAVLAVRTEELPEIRIRPAAPEEPAAPATR